MLEWADNKFCPTLVNTGGQNSIQLKIHRIFQQIYGNKPHLPVNPFPFDFIIITKVRNRRH